MRDAFDKKDPKNWQSCPECGGYGQLEEYVRDYGQPYGPTGEIVYIDCSVCEATGCIPTPHAFIEAHQDLRRELADLLDTTETGVQYLMVQMQALVEEEQS